MAIFGAFGPCWPYNTNLCLKQFQSNLFSGKPVDKEMLQAAGSTFTAQHYCGMMLKLPGLLQLVLPVFWRGERDRNGCFCRRQRQWCRGLCARGLWQATCQSLAILRAAPTCCGSWALTRCSYSRLRWTWAAFAEIYTFLLFYYFFVEEAGLGSDCAVGIDPVKRLAICHLSCIATVAAPALQYPPQLPMGPGSKEMKH